MTNDNRVPTWKVGTQINPEYEKLQSGIRRAGDELLRKYWRSVTPMEATQKESIHSIVTEADKASEEILLNLLRGEEVLSEESPRKINSSDFWVIDPLDGTSFFARGLEGWSITLAHVKNGEVELGLTFAPVENELFYAKTEEGAFLNGKRIITSSTKNLKDSLVNISQAVIRTDEKGSIRKLISNTRTLWSTGSTARALANLAAGRIDVAIHEKQAFWDIAAGTVLVKEAGGKLTNWEESQNFDMTGAQTSQNNILATNGYLYNSVVRYLNSKGV